MVRGRHALGEWSELRGVPLQQTVAAGRGKNVARLGYFAERPGLFQATVSEVPANRRALQDR
jgi:hypothetical protein